VRLAVIPARGGSKRIPRKNVRAFAGKPMIAWSIEAAATTGLFDDIVVSTDDPEIAEVARAAGASIPFMRPPELADDHTGLIPVVRHAIDWFDHAGRAPAEVCCLLATAPFLRAEDVGAGLAAMTRAQAEFALSVTRYAFPIQRAVRMTPDGRLAMFQPEHFATRSQDLEEAFHDAAQFYWGRAGAWRAAASLFTPATVALVLPRARVQDIDTPEDWALAEALFAVANRAGG